MPAHDVCRALHRLVKDRDRALRFRDGDLSAVDLDGLDGDESEALLARDLPRLYALGAHPVLLFHVSAIVFPRTHYIKNVVPAIQGVANPFYDYYVDRDGDPVTTDGEGDDRG